MENWDKKLHIESTLIAKKEQYALFVGRWQPLHSSHKALFNRALNEGKKVCIAIRDVEINENNPFKAEDIKENIEEQLALLVNTGRIKVIIIPDICSIEFGRGVGYDIIEHIPPKEIAEVSATKVREKLKKDGKL